MYKVIMLPCKRCGTNTHVGENGHDPDNVICDSCRLAEDQFKEQVLFSPFVCIYCGEPLEGPPQFMGNRLEFAARANYKGLPICAHLECVYGRWQKKFEAYEKYYVFPKDLEDIIKAETKIHKITAACHDQSLVCMKCKSHEYTLYAGYCKTCRQKELRRHYTKLRLTKFLQEQYFALWIKDKESWKSLIHHKDPSVLYDILNDNK